MNLSKNFLEKLNSAFKADPKAIEELLQHRTPCNTDLSLEVISSREEPLTVSVLGLINTLLETSSNERIAACYREEKLIGFQIYDNGGLTLLSKEK